MLRERICSRLNCRTLNEIMENIFRWNRNRLMQFVKDENIHQGKAPTIFILIHFEEYIGMLLVIAKGECCVVNRIDRSISSIFANDFDVVNNHVRSSHHFHQYLFVFHCILQLNLFVLSMGQMNVCYSEC